MADGTTGVTGALTDGTGVSAGTAKKLFKDFVVDAVKAAGAAIGGIQLQTMIGGFPTDKAGWIIIGTAIGGAALGAAYRAVLRWGDS